MRDGAQLGGGQQRQHRSSSSSTGGFGASRHAGAGAAGADGDARLTEVELAVSRIQASALGREAAQTEAVDECRALCERLQKRTAELSLELTRMDSTVATVLDVELVRVEEGLESRMTEFGRRQGELEGMIKASLEVAQERFRDMSDALQDKAKMSGIGGAGQGGGAVPTRLELASG